MIKNFFEYYRLAIQVIIIIVLWILTILAFVFAINFYQPNFDQLSVPENERTLNAYATFESTCHYRGYDRSECLLIWSGR